MRTIAVLALLLSRGAALAASADPALSDPYANEPASTPRGVRLFHLHDPGLVSNWARFLATTPMLNEEPLPVSLQHRLAKAVLTYQDLTPIGEPAYFVATYIDVLVDQLLAPEKVEATKILPMRVCPVFTGDDAASVGSLLAVASGLPPEVFANAPGQSEHYHFLFLQTEFSHCRFLEMLRADREAGRTSRNAADPETGHLTFNVGKRAYTVILGNDDEVRAVLETVGDIDAINTFRARAPDRHMGDEVDVLRFARLLSLLATSHRSGYAAIPVLFPLLSEGGDEPASAGPRVLRVADAMQVAYAAREVFARIVPFPIRDEGDLLNARSAVVQALGEDGSDGSFDERVSALLMQFVTGSELLLPTAVAQEKMPLISD